jgi:glycyl-tRNA synthetase
MSLCDAYRQDGDRTWLELHPSLAPYKVAVFPLMKKPEIMEYTDRIYAGLKKKFRVTTDDAGSIGKRYRRQDEIGTPLAVTVDFDSLNQNSVTVRHRDSMVQDRISSDQLVQYIEDRFANWNK